MKTDTKRLYEGLFLVDSARAASDWEGTIGAVEKVLTRNGGEIVSLNKWDERKLAYEVEKKSRGTYILVYFNCDTQGISSIERGVQLSEQIMRVMILRTDRMDAADIEKETPAALAVKAVEEAEKKAAEQAAAEAEKQAPQEETKEEEAKVDEPEAEEAKAEEPEVEEAQEVSGQESQEDAGEQE